MIPTDSTSAAVYAREPSASPRPTATDPSPLTSGAASAALLGDALGGGDGLDFLERLIDIGRWRRATDGRGNLAIRSHDESGALGETMTNLDAAGVLGSRMLIGDLEIVGFGDGAFRIRGRRKLSRAILRIRREGVQTLDAVQRHTDDGSPGSGKLVAVDGKGVRLDVAAARVGRRVEVHHHRPLLQGVLQREGEGLTRKGGLGLEIRRRIAVLQSSQSRERDHTGKRNQQRAFTKRMSHTSPGYFGPRRDPQDHGMRDRSARVR